MTGRPSKFTQAIADEICERMIEGEDLVKICKSDHMPSRVTVYRWMADNPAFDAQCARAREGLADHDAAMIAEIAKNTTKATAEGDRVRLAALQWLAAKRAPKRWGDKIELEAKVEVNSGPSEALMSFIAMAEKATNNGGKKDN
jgi:hypothetical protein